MADNTTVKLIDKIRTAGNEIYTKAKGVAQNIGVDVKGYVDSKRSVANAFFKGVKPVLKYPLNIEGEVNDDVGLGHYVIFNIFEYYAAQDSDPLANPDPNIPRDAQDLYYNKIAERKVNKIFRNLGGSLANKSKLIRDTIILYTPNNIGVNNKVNYEAGDIGLLTRLIGNATELESGNLQSNTGAAVASAAQLLRFAGELGYLTTLGGIGGIQNLIQTTTGVAGVASQDMLFTGIDHRSFSFDYKFTATSAEEAREIKNILDRFQYHMLPLRLTPNTGSAYVIPSEFAIRYMYKNKENHYLNKILRVVLEDMQVSYGGGKFQTYRADSMGAPPVEITCKLQFKEIELMTRDKMVEFGPNEEVNS